MVTQPLIKYIMMDDDIRNSFLSTFTDFSVTKSTSMTEFMNPINSYVPLRYLFGKTGSVLVAHDFFSHNSKTGIKVVYDGREHRKSTECYIALMENFRNIKSLIPTKEYNGSMDLVCLLPSGEKILVEIQVVPQDF